jgi:hypothetical protein
MVPAQMPIAMLSFSAGNVLRRIARLAGWSSAPAKPWTTRQKITISIEPERPTATEATAKPATPTRNTVLRPNRSASRPATIRETARASR